MPETPEVPQETPCFTVLNALDLAGPLHGCGIARRIKTEGHS